MSKTGTSLLTKTPVNRHRYGDLHEVVVPVITSKAAGRNEIATGDLVYVPTATMSTSLGTVGSCYPYTGLVEARLASAADVFLGVAMDSSANGDSDDIVVATAGVFEFDCASGTVTVGMSANLTASIEEDGYCDCHSVLLGAGGTALGAWLDSNRIGTVVSKGTTKTSVLVQIRSKVMDGNVEATA